MSAVKKAFKKIKKIGKKIRKATVPKFIRKIEDKIKKNKFVRAIVIAAAIYFTAGAALGALGAMSAGGSMLAGAQAGLASAWGGITGAGSALAAGQLGAAGSSLAGGITGASAAGAATAGAGAAAAGAAAGGAATTGATAGATTGATTGATAGATTGATTGATAGAGGLTVGEGIQLASLGMSGYGMYKQAKAGDSYSPNNMYGLDENGQAFNEAGMGEMTMYNAMTGSNRYATGMSPPSAGSQSIVAPQAGVDAEAGFQPTMPQPGTQLNSLDDVIELKQRQPHRITYS